MNSIGTSVGAESAKRKGDSHQTAETIAAIAGLRVQVDRVAVRLGAITPEFVDTAEGRLAERRLWTRPGNHLAGVATDLLTLESALAVGAIEAGDAPDAEAEPEPAENGARTIGRVVAGQDAEALAVLTRIVEHFDSLDAADQRVLDHVAEALWERACAHAGDNR